MKSRLRPDPSLEICTSLHPQPGAAKKSGAPDATLPQPERAHGDDVFDTVAAADYLKVSKQFLEQIRIKGGGPKFSRVGPRLVRYRRASLDKWLYEHECANTSEYGV